MKLYDGRGNLIEVSNSDTKTIGIASASKTMTPYGIRRNIVQTLAYDDAGAQRWLEAGLRFKRTDPTITEFTLTYTINVTGNATKVQLKCSGNGEVSANHDYTGGEMTFTDVFSDATKLNSDYISFYTTISTANVEDATYNGTGVTLKIAEIPEGLELVEEYIKRAPTLTTNILTFDEDPVHQRYASRWWGKKWMSIGDSITQGVEPHYPRVASQILQMTVSNAGRGGSALVQWANGMLYDAYYQGYDLVTIMHGVNDHDNSPNSPLGVLQPHGSEFDKSTYIGAYQYIIETIKSNSPNTEIALLKSTYVSNDDWVNNVGLNMTDYRNAVDVVAESYGLPVFDASTVITKDNYKTYLMDGVHPNPAGYAMLGEAIGKWLATI